MILAINTSTLEFGLAILEDDGTVLTEYSMSKGAGHFGSLMPALHFLLTTSESDIRDLEAIVVAIGPGSFTGLRVGLSIAKGLCHALDIPIIGISSLEALASELPSSDLPLAPILDSRKGEFFTARFSWNDDNNLIRCTEDVSLRLEEFPTLFKEPALFIGNNFAGQSIPVKKTLGPLALMSPSHCWSLKASAVGSLGLRRFHAHDFDDLHTLSPIYLRPPDIRPNVFSTPQTTNNR
ncbi:MAG: tRNA (adenosine(37)-N6)-threonylcarbamoyltransferase complex dimerization subunit type 1 TsaB [Thermodesulfobacteriota bacterium]|nr:tRNA (adenosine(37)-N6)-threonylcarbamoyltransferase complex dimerization subunit type 1 TsaB [Thermodesulfobacteriota bacterium]